MNDYFNLLIGIAMILLGFIFAIPNIKDKLDNKPDKYGSTLKGTVAGILLILGGLIMALRAIF